ncbi:hypothetical protein NQ152_00230 [Microbacterium sp. zg.B48]|uniref:hypothetical protein n=1 Tax=Microbacterium sp. zg.B48 TaxID=2969408 RepID=UPI00214BFECB|nr:hypothetical protein [Microbacterium sp. zg.B48]MCR2761930.1 hypothetical protein [Microbacterium sp. zg.B48]
MTDSAQDRLSRGYRVIRALQSGKDSAWPGSLVSGPGGEMGVAVDAETLGADWPGWSAGADGHVLAPLDVLRRPDGHDVLLPVCTERIEDFLARRGPGDEELSPPEAVTLGVSLLRGLAELPESADARGSWWLTDAGRPVFACGSGDSPAAEATIGLLGDLAHSVPAVADALADVVVVADDPRRLRRELERAEERLFAVAAPAALATTSFGPRRARSVAARPQEGATAPEAADTVSAWPFTLARHVDADWADLVSRVTTGLWRTLRARRPTGRRKWLVAGGLACAVVVAGVLWPGTADGPSAADPAAGTAVPGPSPGPTPQPTSGADVPSAKETAPPPVVDGGGDDLTSIAESLLTARIACNGEPDCLGTVLEAPGASFPPGVVDLPTGERSVTLLDEFGGAAVLRAEATGTPPQLVVLVHSDGGWLLRDVYDVAQQ